MTDIIGFIKKEMADRAMTYDLLAEKAGMSKQNLWMKLNKNTRPNFDTVVKILKALDYVVSIKKIDAEEFSKDEMTKVFFEAAQEEQIGFDCISKLLKATGNELTIENSKKRVNG